MSVTFPDGAATVALLVATAAVVFFAIAKARERHILDQDDVQDVLRKLNARTGDTALAKSGCQAIRAYCMVSRSAAGGTPTSSATDIHPPALPVRRRPTVARPVVGAGRNARATRRAHDCLLARAT